MNVLLPKVVYLQHSGHHLLTIEYKPNLGQLKALPIVQDLLSKHLGNKIMFTSDLKSMNEGTKLVDGQLIKMWVTELGGCEENDRVEGPNYMVVKRENAL